MGSGLVVKYKCTWLESFLFLSFPGENFSLVSVEAPNLSGASISEHHQRIPNLMRHVLK